MDKEITLDKISPNHLSRNPGGDMKGVSECDGCQESRHSGAGEEYSQA